MSEVGSIVFDIIAREARIERASIEESSTLQSLAIASIDLLQIVFALEERFDITIPYGDPKQSFATAGELVTMIEQLVPARAEA
jgi:acyl carrier protein